MDQTKEADADAFYVVNHIPQNEDGANSAVGQAVGISFDYGTVQHPKYGSADLVGISPCFEPFEDYNSVLQDKMDSGESSDELRELQMSVWDDLTAIGLGVEENENEATDMSTLLKVMGQCYTMDTFDLCSVLYTGIPICEIKPYLLLNMVLILYEDLSDQASSALNSRINLHSINTLLKSVLTGGVTHVSQINPGTPSQVKIILGLVILLRKSALNSKSPGGWSFLAQDFLHYVQAAKKETNKSTPWTLKEYLHARPYSVAMGTILEADWMIRGISVPDDVRNDYDFDQFKTSLALTTGLQNDIVGLQKEILRGEAHNVVLILAEERHLSLQEAIKESMTVLTNVWVRAKIAGQSLLLSFPKDPVVKQLVREAGRAVDFCIPLLHSIPARYGWDECGSDERPLSYVLIKFKLAAPSIEPGSEEPIQKKQLELKISTKIEEKSSQPSPTMISHEIKQLGIIPDGNRRWALKRRLPPWAGHEAGRHVLQKVVRQAWTYGIHTVTIWGLSPENINRRPKEELDHLWIILENAVRDFRTLADEFNGSFVHIGNKHRLPRRISKVIEKNELETIERKDKCLVLAIDYGGREEIVPAVNRCRENRETETLTENDISKNTWTGELCPWYENPDLIVRAGVQDSATFRLSGFMSWQFVYSQLYFEEKYFPDVGEEDVMKWIAVFNKTERRFGIRHVPISKVYHFCVK